MNQQQLQIARAALWRQNAEPLATWDDAAAWLDATGFCLFLPRHAQLPAPAPSFVEACMGAPSATPPAPAIASAMEMAMRLMEAGRALPLNLFGTFSEQPDFLVTPEVLPWVAAVRGDRQWQKAPAGRTAPIVLRTWEALEQHGSQTAVEIRERLGRELTEAAVLRALIELWTTLRALPSYAAGEPTRWRLLKDSHAAQLTTAANTAQPTALSALLSVYLRSAVAATAEEAEIFLSPLTARSRIREVTHGMMAARQLGSVSVASHTPSIGSQSMLFIEGSLPEAPPEAAEATTPEAAQEARARRESIRRQPREPERPGRFDRSRPPGPQRPMHFSKSRPSDRERQDGFRENRPSARPSPSDRPGGRPSNRQSFSRPPFGKKREWQPRDRPAGPGRNEAPRFAASRGERPFHRDRADASRDERTQRERPGSWQPRDAKPRQKPGAARFGKPAARPNAGSARSEGPRQERPRQDRPQRENRPRWQPRENAKPWQKPGAPRFRKPAEGPNAGGPRSEGPRQDRPWQKRRPPFAGDRGRGERPPKKFGSRPAFSRPGQNRPRPGQNRPSASPQSADRPEERRPSARPAGTSRRDSGPGSASFDRSKPRFGKPPRSGSPRPASAGKPRFGKFSSGKIVPGQSRPEEGRRSGRPPGGKFDRNSAQRAKKPGEFRSSRPPQKNFLKPRARKPNPGKNRNQEDSPS